MKKIFFAIAIVLTLGLTANAQNKHDAFVSNLDNGNRGWGDDNLSLILPTIGLGETGNQGAPLGSGLLVLTALGAGYAVARKNRK